MTRNQKDDIERLARAQQDFERSFGVDDNTKAYISEYLHELVIVVENEKRVAYYNFSIELLKVINLR